MVTPIFMSRFSKPNWHLNQTHANIHTSIYINERKTRIKFHADICMETSIQIATIDPGNPCNMNTDRLVYSICSKNKIKTDK